MDPMQWSIWSTRASYPSHVATPSDPLNPLVQSTLLLHRVNIWLTTTCHCTIHQLHVCALNYRYILFHCMYNTSSVHTACVCVLCTRLLIHTVVFPQLHDHQKAHHPSPLVHSDPSQGPILQVLHSSESGGEEQWTSAITTVTGSRGHGDEEEHDSEGTLRGLAEPLLSQQTEEYQTHTAVEMLEPK